MHRWILKCLTHEVRNQANFDRVVGKQLRQFRGRNGMTIDQLAEAIGLNGRDIARFETGQKRISAPLLFSLAKLLGIPVADFFRPAGAWL